jgi:hypothetical protein
VSSATLILRVSSASFDRVVRGVSGLGEVLAESISAQDITEAYYDLQARLKNARRLEARFLELLEKQTGKVSDLLEVERELARVREQIEQFEGKLRLFDHQVELSTLTVQLSIRQEFQAGQPRGLGGELSETFVTSISALRSMAVGLLNMVVALVPWAPVAALVWFGIARLRRRRRAA